MKKIICIILLFALLLCGCGPQTVDPTEAPTVEPTQAELPPETEAPTQEPTMSEEEAQAILQERRDIVEAEMRRMMSVLWRCDSDFVYEYRTIRAGRVYSGIPYTHASGSEAGFFTYGELGEDGVYNLTGLTAASVTGTSGTGPGNCARVGNDCNDAIFWSWAKISPTINFGRCLEMKETTGCIKVGQYVCDGLTYTDTAQTVQKNGEETMFAAYMQLQKGDALVMFDGAYGHALMFVDIHVEYTADGRIDAENSYCLVHEQGGGGDQDGKTYFDEALGETVHRIGSTDNKYTFRKLIDKGYLPVTIKELVDPSPLEEPWVEDSLEKCTIDNLQAGKITSNYRISHVTVSVVAENGQTVQTSTCYVREEERYCFQMKMFRVDSVLGVLNGELDLDALPAGSYTCTVTCHISTGDTFTVRQFDFSK